MTHHENVKIIAFVGLAGSGKTSAIDYMTQKGHPKVYFGGIVLDEVAARGLELTQENERPIREELREKEGKDFIAKRAIPQIHQLIAAGQHRIVIDGLYSWSEYKTLKHEFPGELTVVAMITPKHIRYHRLVNRLIRPLSESDASKRDWAEIEGIEKGGPIAIADYYIHNEAGLEQMHQQIDEIAERVGF